MNNDGFPIPLLRDKSKGGSTTLTMYWITFVFALVLLSGKAADKFGAVEYSNVLWLLGITGSMYLGRKIQGNGKDFNFDSKKEDEKD